MSGTDTPEELELDFTERGGAAWANACLELIEGEQGIKRL